MSLLGKSGMKEVAINSTHKAHYLCDRLTEMPHFDAMTSSPFYREFLLKSTVPVTTLNKHLNDRGILSLKVIDETLNIVQLAVTENRTKEELDYMIQVMEELK